MKRIYNIIIFALFFGVSYSQPVEGLTELQVTGLTTEDGNYTFHFYNANGKLTQGYSEVFIALTDKNNQFVEDFSVSNFLPLMNMGSSKHSTPIGKVEKVEDKTLYKTWFSFLMYTGQMGGAWTLDFDYVIGGAAGKITEAVPTVDAYPAGVRWLHSFAYNGKTYYVSLVSPQSLGAGSQTVRAYINKRENLLLPYEIVEGGFRIEATPFMLSMGHGSNGNTPLIWDDEDGVYKGTLNFSMQGDWRINLKIFDTEDNLIAGTDIDSNGNGSTLFWDILIDKNLAITQIEIPTIKTAVYPTVSQGEFTITSTAEAKVKIIDFAGRTVASYRISEGSSNIRLDAVNGVYLVVVEDGKTASTHKIILRR
ncbi:MAG: FixH family protein [Flavobacteriaceae bacterium]|nr:FixH family protein [Flavobacteriaceae bacterium]